MFGISMERRTFGRHFGRSMRRHPGLLLLIFCGLFFPLSSFAQAPPSIEEIPLERCDTLPVIQVRAGERDLRFLVDTAATSFLNAQSFSSGDARKIRVFSWKGSADAASREISLPEMRVGVHRLRDLHLPAVDLNPIARACGGRIDGILGVDLMDRMGITLDLKRRVALFAISSEEAGEKLAQMMAAMSRCNEAFQAGSQAVLEDCFDSQAVLYTPEGEYHGRKEVIAYLRRTYLKYAPNLRYVKRLKQTQVFGDAVWYSYDYSVEAPNLHLSGHGMATCQLRDGRWRIVNMHNSQIQPRPASP